MSPAQTTNSLTDENQIRDLVARYADAVTRRDEKAWAETWTEDGEWQVMGRTASGREAVVELWKSLMGGLSFVVQLANTERISIEGDRGSGRWYVTEYAKSSDGTALLNVGFYRDEYVRIDGVWRFARRRFDALYIGPPDLSGATFTHPEEVSS
ncbi:MAG: nuclear transport factor 2 family protein [Myxococcota bacterium]|nr:nuclear transport factor 2 family protein [Myxococcota bacterium]